MTNATNALITETIRLANRDHGIWVKAEQVTKHTKNAESFEPATVAAEISKQVRALENMTVAQAADHLDNCLDLAVDALNAAAEAELATGEELAADHPLMLAYDWAADNAEEAEALLVAIAGRKAIELAATYSPTEKAIVAELFAPALENRYADYTPEQRAKLVAKAHALAACL